MAELPAAQCSQLHLLSVERDAPSGEAADLADCFDWLTYARRRLTSDLTVGVETRSGSFASHPCCSHAGHDLILYSSVSESGRDWSYGCLFRSSARERSAGSSSSQA